MWQGLIQTTIHESRLITGSSFISVKKQIKPPKWCDRVGHAKHDTQIEFLLLTGSLAVYIISKVL